MNLNTIFIVVMVLAVCLLWYLLRREMYLHRSANEYVSYLSAENQARKQHLQEVYDVIEKCAGGVEKRISEHLEIKNAIQGHVPDLFEAEPAMRHWLSANEQFCRALQDVSASPKYEIGTV